jgi:hypothetical protein
MWAGASVTLHEVDKFTIGEAEVDIHRPVCALLARQGEAQITMHLTAAAASKGWKYDAPPTPSKSAAAPSKQPAAPSHVFTVRCEW